MTVRTYSGQPCSGAKASSWWTRLTRKVRVGISAQPPDVRRGSASPFESILRMWAQPSLTKKAQPRAGKLTTARKSHGSHQAAEPSRRHGGKSNNIGRLRTTHNISWCHLSKYSF